MFFHSFIKMSPHAVRKFIIHYLGFTKENGYDSVKVKRNDNFSFTVKIIPTYYKNFKFLPIDYGVYNFIPYKDTFFFENSYEGINFNENGKNNKIWQEYIKNKEKTKIKKLITFFAST